MMIKLIYAHEKWDGTGPSIFLAGPSPRDESHYDWRPEAVECLSRLDFDGAIFIPLPRDGKWLEDYDAQILWELEYLDRATCVAFWIPRSQDLPGYTTNVEFGMYLRSRKIVLGFPEDALKMRYLQFVARKEGVPVFNTLEETLHRAVFHADADREEC